MTDKIKISHSMLEYINRFLEYIKLEIELGNIKYGSPIEQNYRAYMKELEHTKNLQKAKIAEIKRKNETQQELIYKIRQTVCNYFNISQGELSIDSRREPLAKARQYYAFLCNKYTDYTLTEIGHSINRTHSTIIYMLEAVESRINFDKRTKEILSALMLQVNQLKEPSCSSN